MHKFPHDILYSLSYDSIYNNIDLDIDIETDSVKETIILNSPNFVQEQFSYLITADNLEAELMDDGTVLFSSLSGETIFSIPPAFMFNSSDDMEYCYDVKTTIERYGDKYLLKFIPDIDWIKDENRVYPVMIDPTISAQGDMSKHGMVMEQMKIVQERHIGHNIFV